jgi:probable HAF family extracellular repeat protein
VAILGSLGGTASRGLDLNSEIRVAGKSSLANSLSRATLWIPQEPPVDLGTLGGRDSEALGMNEISQVVGWADDVSERKRPFLWPVGSEMIDLNTLGGDEGEAHEINDAGFVVGWSEDQPAVNTKSATLWTPGGEIVDLGGLEGGSESFARDINSTGTVVGWADTPDGDRHAVMWSLGNGGTPSVDEILSEMKEVVLELGQFGTLRRGVAHALTAKLIQVERKINEGKLRPAINQLGAFINQVNALVRSRRLRPEQGAELIELAEAAIAALESGD